MRKLNLLALFLGIYLFAGSASATTYYISYSSGSNSNSGTSQSAPWKTHPFMQSGGACTGSGSAPSYSHAAGDQFVFKQGDSWPNACFDMVIQAGGSPGNPDVYTFDPTWGTPSGATGSLGQPVGTYQFNAGGSAIHGADGWNDFVFDNGANYVTFNGVELTGMFWSGCGSFGNVQMFQLQSTHDFLLTNAWAHAWTHAGGSGGDCLTVMVGHDGSPFNANSGLENSVVDGANSGGAGVADSGEATFKMPLCIGNIIRNVSNACLTNVNGLVHDNFIGPVNQSFDSSDHENCIENIDSVPSGMTGSLYIYNNVIHDCTAVNMLLGGLSAGGSNKIYVWNNVDWVGSVGQPPIPIAFSEQLTGPNNEVHAWNNTVYGGSQTCFRTFSQGGSQFAVVDIQNNHCISDQGLILQEVSGAAQTISNNVTMSTGQASSAGFSSSEGFAFAPPSSSSGTVGAGANLAGLASGPFATLMLDTTYGGTRTAKSRPSSGAWDVGAYEFSSSGSSSGVPAPPTNVKIVAVQ